MAAFVKLPYVMRIIGQGDTKCSVVAALRTIVPRLADTRAPLPV